MVAGALAIASSEQLAFAGSHLTGLCLVPCCKRLLGQDEGREEDKKVNKVVNKGVVCSALR